MQAVSNCVPCAIIAPSPPVGLGWPLPGLWALSHSSVWPGDVWGQDSKAGLSHPHMHIPHLQIHATMVAPALTASARSSASAWLVSVGRSVRRTSTSAPATPARTVPTAPTASTATPAPAPLALAASTVRTTHLTAQRGTALCGHSLCRGWNQGLRSLCCPGLVWGALVWDTISCDSLGHDVCVPSSCFNGGTCVDGINTFTCLCPPGFTGSYCEHDINECDSKPCLNGGTCQDSYGTYKCTCPQGYTGLNCQVEEPWAVGCCPMSVPACWPWGCGGSLQPPWLQKHCWVLTPIPCSAPPEPGALVRLLSLQKRRQVLAD